MSEPKQISVHLNVQDGIYYFSDGYKMPLQAYTDYVEAELNSEYPTEPRETSEAIFKARERAGEDA